MKNATWTAASPNDIPTIRKLAHEIWPATFSKILTKEQIAYMLHMMYSEEILSKNMGQGHLFYLLKFKGANVGFAHLENGIPEKEHLRIHKLYLHPSCQGIGLGRWMLHQIDDLARRLGLQHLHLNVNRYNRSVAFYERCGFKIVKEEDIDIGSGYLMEDFQMVKAV